MSASLGKVLHLARNGQKEAPLLNEDPFTSTGEVKRYFKMLSVIMPFMNDFSTRCISYCLSSAQTANNKSFAL